jgi:hypothetical protein
MRETNQRVLNTAIYARIRELQISQVDRDNAIRALEQAERITGVYLWLKEKLATVGNVFLKPSLKH